MKKIIFLAVLFLSLGVNNLFAELVEYNGCKDIIKNIDSQNSKFMKKSLNENLKIKREFLLSLGFNINDSVTYFDVCRKVYLMNTRNLQEAAYSTLNTFMDELLLESNNINFDEYSRRVNSKLSGK